MKEEDDTMSKSSIKETRKTIVLGQGISSLGSLKKALSRCDDNSRLEVKLCIGESKDDDFAVDHLQTLCNKLYNCLLDAKTCIEIVADEETVKDQNLIYYDKVQGFNGGAKDLLKTVNNLLDDYPREMVQIDLER